MSFPVQRIPSGNFDERAGDQAPSLILLHYTGTLTSDDARDRFLEMAPTDAVGRISPHYLIDGDGKVIQFVDEDKRAWHGGRGCWKNHTDINSASIGIEIWNSGHEYELEDFLDVQIESLTILINDIRTRWQIKDQDIIGHSDTAPGRKVDPGEKFPWHTLCASGIGLMPNILPEDELLAAQWMDQPDEILKALHAYGYDPAVDPATLLDEFRRHFLPAELGRWGADIVDCTALASLLRQARDI